MKSLVEEYVCPLSNAGVRNRYGDCTDPDPLPAPVRRPRLVYQPAGTPSSGWRRSSGRPRWLRRRRCRARRSCSRRRCTPSDTDRSQARRVHLTRASGTLTSCRSAARPRRAPTRRRPDGGHLPARDGRLTERRRTATPGPFPLDPRPPPLPAVIAGSVLLQGDEPADDPFLRSRPSPSGIRSGVMRSVAGSPARICGNSSASSRSKCSATDPTPLLRPVHAERGEGSAEMFRAGSTYDCCGCVPRLGRGSGCWPLSGPGSSCSTRRRGGRWVRGYVAMPTCPSSFPVRGWCTRHR